MLFQLIVLVILMMVITYSWPPAKVGGSSMPKGKGGGFFNFGRARKDSPFHGPYTTPPSSSGNHTIDRGSLTRCHNCSCFFPMGQVVHEIVEGHLLEFCSTDCRRNFLSPRG